MEAMNTQPQPSLRLFPSNRPRRLRSIRGSSPNARSRLLNDFTLKRERLVVRYDAAVRRADVAEGYRNRLAAKITAVDRVIAALAK